MSALGRYRQDRSRLRSVGAVLVGAVAVTGALVAPTASAAVAEDPRWWPLAGAQGDPVVGCTWGKHCAGAGKVYHGYAAIDVLLADGTPVYAAGSGEVIGVQNCPNSPSFSCGLNNFGNYVKIAHATRDSYYAHLSRVVRTAGWVNTGELIGYSGNSGYSTAPHLHYEERPKGGGWGSQVDPGKTLANHGGALVEYPAAAGYSGWEQVPYGTVRVRNDGYLAGGRFTGQWHLNNGHDGTTDDLKYYGSDGDIPVVGDWDGDGVDTLGIVRAGVWHLNNQFDGSADATFGYGNATGDIPVVGDWDGDGDDTPGIVRAGVWHLNNQFDGSADATFGYGNATGDIPVVGDWDGDRDDTPGIVRAGVWHLNNHLDGIADGTVGYGNAGDGFSTGDWNGDGVTSLGVTR